MTELSFAQQFLTTLDSQPVRIPSDHVEDPKKYPARPAVCSYHDTSVRRNKC